MHPSDGVRGRLDAVEAQLTEIEEAGGPIAWLNPKKAQDDFWRGWPASLEARAKLRAKAAESGE